MKLKSISLLLFVFIPVVVHAESVTIPKGSTITVDGVSAEQEWDDATTVDFEGGEYLKMKQDGEYVLLAIKGEKLGISSVAIHAENEVKILHASAGLITAVYNRQGESWVQTEEFRSERQRMVSAEKDNPARIAKNLELYGWGANILPLKPPVDFDQQTVTEYKISLSLLKNGVSTLSVVFSQRTAKLPLARAPKGLADDSLLKSMVHGANVEILHFAPDTWLRLEW